MVLAHIPGPHCVHHCGDHSAGSGMTELEKAIALMFVKVANEVSAALADKLYEINPETMIYREPDDYPYAPGEGAEDFEEEAKAVVKMVVNAIGLAIKADQDLSVN